jgi:hypothetical protein
MWDQVIAPFFVENNVSRVDYLDKLEQFVVPQLQVMKNHTIFHKDGVQSHRQTLVRNSLAQMFQG